jgi:hypothetical protein
VVRRLKAWQMVQPVAANAWAGLARKAGRVNPDVPDTGLIRHRHGRARHERARHGRDIAGRTFGLREKGRHSRLPLKVVQGANSVATAMMITPNKIEPRGRY